MRAHLIKSFYSCQSLGGGAFKVTSEVENALGSTWRGTIKTAKDRGEKTHPPKKKGINAIKGENKIFLTAVRIIRAFNTPIFSYEA